MPLWLTQFFIHHIMHLAAPLIKSIPAGKVHRLRFLDQGKLLSALATIRGDAVAPVGQPASGKSPVFIGRLVRVAGGELMQLLPPGSTLDHDGVVLVGVDLTARDVSNLLADRGSIQPSEMSPLFPTKAIQSFWYIAPMPVLWRVTLVPGTL
jgi:hypothetical protein